MKRITKVGVIANVSKPEAIATLRQLVSLLRARNIRVVAEIKTAPVCGCPISAKPLSNLARSVDVLAAIGGDGTMLRVARGIDGLPTPIFGINLGGLGFLTTTASQDLPQSVGALLAGKFRLTDRSMIEARVVRNGKRAWERRALNDIVLARGATARIVRIEVRVDDELLGDYLCDGLIFSTPTGSTAYSLSAGGPIVTPTARAMIIAPICPHAISNRPVVVGADAEMTARLSRTGHKAHPDRHASDLILSVDGQEQIKLSPRDEVRLRTAKPTVRLITLPGHSFLEVLRRKLHWRGAYV